MAPFSEFFPQTTFLTRFSGALQAVALSPNQRWVVAAQAQSNRPTPTLTLFDRYAPRTQRRVLRQTEHWSHAVFDAVFVDDNHLLFLEEPTTGQHAYQLLDLRTGDTQTLLTLPRQYRWPRLRAGGGLLLAPTTPPVLYDVSARQAVRQVLLPPQIAAGAVFGTDDAQHVLVTTAEHRFFERFDLDAQRVVQRYDLPVAVWGTPFASRNYCGAIGDGSNGAYLWHKATGEPVGATWLNSRQSYVFSFCLSPDEQRVGIGTISGLVYVVEIESGDFVFSERLHGHDRVWALAFSTDGQILVSGGSRGDVMVTELPR